MKHEHKYKNETCTDCPQEPTRECCEKCKKEVVHSDWFNDGRPCSCFCHSMKPPKCKHKNIGKEITAPYNLVCNDCLEVISIKPPVEKECGHCWGKKPTKCFYPLRHQECCVCSEKFNEDSEELSPEVGDFRWKDTKGKVKGEVLAKDYENWLEKNAYNLECWTGEEWKSLVSPELSWELEFDEKIKVPWGNHSKLGIEIKSFIKKVEQQAFNSGRASMVEIIKSMKKVHKEFECNGANNGKGCYEMFCEDQNCRNAPKEYNQALDDILQALKNKENEE